MPLLRLLLVLALGVVPVIGVYTQGWSVASALALYWIGNVLDLLATTLIIGLHWRWTRRRGHWRTTQVGTLRRGRNGVETPLLAHSLLAAYAGSAGAFTAVHGLFVGGFLYLARQNFAADGAWRLSPDELQRGTLWLLVPLALQLLPALAALRAWPFAQVKALADAQRQRVVVLHLTLVVGGAVFLFGRSAYGFLWTMALLKMLADLAAGAPSGGAAVSAGAAAERAQDEEVVPPGVEPSG